jgi:protease I
MSAFLAHRTIGFLVAQHGVDECELVGPRDAARAAGATTVLIAPSLGSVTTTHEGLPHGSHVVDWTIACSESRDVDALVLPDGEQNSRALRADGAVTLLVREFVGSGKPVGAFGFSVLSLMDAGVVGQRDVTSSPSLAGELTRAGARWHDRRVVVDENVITSRDAHDVDAFNLQLMAYLDR